MNNIINLLKKHGVDEWWRVNIPLFLRLESNNYKIGLIYKLILNYPSILPPILSTLLVFNKILTELVSLFSTKNRKNDENNLDVLFVTHDRWTWKYNSETRENKLSFEYYDGIRTHLPRDINVTYIQEGLFMANYRKLLDIIKYGTYPITNLVKYATFSHLKLIFQTYPSVKSICKSIEEDYSTEIQKISDVFGKEINEIKDLLKLSILIDYLSTLIHDDIVRCCITEKKPSCVVLISEQSEFGRSWVKTSNEHRIATFGLQHGIVEHIGEGINLPYCCIRTPGRDDKFMYPLPEKLLVYGLNDKKYLVSTLNYPENKIEVTGNPRYDTLYNIHNKHSRMVFCKKHGLDSSSKIVLWIMQMIGFSEEENEAYLQEVLSAISSTPNTILIMKRHPSDNESSMALIQDFIQRYGEKDRIIIPKADEDTTELIYISDIIINKHSTAGQEAVVLKKPMLILDFTPDVKQNPYVLEEVGIPIESPDMLKEALTNLCVPKNISENQDRYVRNHMYKNDGQSSQRVAEVIMQHIKTSNN